MFQQAAEVKDIAAVVCTSDSAVKGHLGRGSDKFGIFDEDGASEGWGARGSHEAGWQRGAVAHRQEQTASRIARCGDLNL